MDDDDDTKQLPLVKDETRGGRRHPQKQGSAIDLDIGVVFAFLSTPPRRNSSSVLLVVAVKINEPL